MNPDIFLASKCKEAVSALYGFEPADGQVQIQSTRKEFEGDYTLVVFPFVKAAKCAPEACAEAIGKWLSENVSEVASYNVIKGFLNISLSPLFWNEALEEITSSEDFGQLPSNGKTVMVEFSSPNTNKPLHLGHVRNILLGWSVSELMKAGGYRVIRVNLVNDRGIHICKSMIAWLKTGNGVTPQSSGIKGDHLVGDFYVKFNDLYKEEVEKLVSEGMTKEEAEKNAPILKEAQEMLVKWEQGDKDTVELWKTMNGWVYEGFDKTYGELGIVFDKTYYAYVNKYQPQQGENITDANIPLLRLSEAYLNAAEAAVKVSDNDKAVKYLDAIVRRANPDRTVEGKTLTLDDVLNERRKELVAEGHRMYDVIRNGLTVHRINDSDKKLSKTKHNTEYMDYDWNFYKILLPIPKKEMDTNPNMVQNPGYGD